MTDHTNDQEMSDLMRRYFALTFEKLKGELGAVKASNPVDKDGDTQPSASCAFVSALVESLRESLGPAALLQTLITSQGNLGDAASKLEHLVVHLVFETGLAAQALIERGELSRDDLYPPAWDSYEGDIDREESMRIMQAALGEESRPTVQTSLPDGISSLDELFSAMENLMADEDDDESKSE